MSLNHIRQAQQLAITNKLDSIDRAILIDIAADIGYDGSPAFPSYATISERTGYHKNTVANRVNGLIENGVLIASKRGRGNQYTLADCGTEFQEDEPEQKPQNDDVSMAERLTHLEKRLAHLEALLTHDRHIIDTSLTHENAKPTHEPPSIDTSLDVTEEEVLSEKLEEHAPPPSPDEWDVVHTLPSGGEHYQRWENQNITLTRNGEEILGYLLDICQHINRTKLPDARELSKFLDGEGIDSATVKDALSSPTGYWCAEDWRGQKGDKPYLSQVETAVMEHVKRGNVPASAFDQWFDSLVAPMLPLQPHLRRDRIKGLPEPDKAVFRHAKMNSSLLSDPTARERLAGAFTQVYSQSQAVGD